MELAAAVDWFVYFLDAALLGFVAFGGYLVMGGGRFHRDAPEDATRPYLDLRREL